MLTVNFDTIFSITEAALLGSESDKEPKVVGNTNPRQILLGKGDSVILTGIFARATTRAVAGVGQVVYWLQRTDSEKSVMKYSLILAYGIAPVCPFCYDAFIAGKHCLHAYKLAYSKNPDVMETSIPEAGSLEGHVAY